MGYVQRMLQAMRCCGELEPQKCSCENCCYEYCDNDCQSLPRNAADLIEDQAAELDAMRNELCRMCGKYQVAHLGACDGCRWKEV